MILNNKLIINKIKIFLNMIYILQEKIE
jgi:hypothetical protein